MRPSEAVAAASPLRASGSGASAVQLVFLPRTWSARCGVAAAGTTATAASVALNPSVIADRVFPTASAPRLRPPSPAPGMRGYVAQPEDARGALGNPSESRRRSVQRDARADAPGQAGAL